MDNHKELLSKPVWQMTGEEVVNLLTMAIKRNDNGLPPVQSEACNRRYVYGIKGISKIFDCSLATANRIKKSGKIDKAIRQLGRKIIVDADLAVELVGQKNN